MGRSPLRIANGAGFLGDHIAAPRTLVESAQVDYLTLEYLAELTMSILARLREQDPQQGYARDFLEVLASLVPALETQTGLRVVTNAGGVQPRACVRAAAQVLVAAGLGTLRLGCVDGDDLLPDLDRCVARGWRFPHLDSGTPFAQPLESVVCAHAYVGAAPLAAALREQARIVVSGRVADASLTLGPCLHEFSWEHHDWDRLAGASVAGHLIECGAQVTGGYSTRWRGIDLARVGYPIAEIDADGSAVITKPVGSGGLVDRLAVAQQLIYEIGDPQHYLTPDVDVDFTSVELREVGPDRVRVEGARGGPPPATLKVSLAYRAGYACSSELLVVGPDARDKATAIADLVWQRLANAGWELDAAAVELLGAAEPHRVGGRGQADVASGSGPMTVAGELVLRLAVRDHRRAAVERFAREIAPLITSGPAGIAGYAAGRPRIIPAFAYWPTSIPREWVQPRVETRCAVDWLGRAE